MPRLEVNIDHVATLRQARLTNEPDPVTAAALAEMAGADGIIVHLREDRRHIQDRDVEILRKTITTKLNLEMAATPEMLTIAREVKPDLVTLVPEKRQELTTEGGLEVAGNKDYLKNFVQDLKEVGLRVSLFVDPVTAQVDAAREVGAETILRRNLDRLPPDRWDYVLIDCPPTLGVLTVNALVAVAELLVPVEAHVMALSGLAQLLQTVEVVRDRLNPSLRVSGILACRVDFRTRHAREVVEQLRQRSGSLVYHTVIRENIRLAECPSFGQAITAYDGKSAGAADYRALADEIISQEGS